MAAAVAPRSRHMHMRPDPNSLHSLPLTSRDARPVPSRRVQFRSLSALPRAPVQCPLVSSRLVSSRRLSRLQRFSSAITKQTLAATVCRAKSTWLNATDDTQHTPTRKQCNTANVQLRHDSSYTYLISNHITRPRDHHNITVNYVYIRPLFRRSSEEKTLVQWTADMIRAKPILLSVVLSQNSHKISCHYSILK